MQLPAIKAEDIAGSEQRSVERRRIRLMKVHLLTFRGHINSITLNSISINIFVKIGHA